MGPHTGDPGYLTVPTRPRPYVPASGRGEEAGGKSAGESSARRCGASGTVSAIVREVIRESCHRGVDPQVRCDLPPHPEGTQHGVDLPGVPLRYHWP